MDLFERVDTVAAVDTRRRQNVGLLALLRKMRLSARRRGFADRPQIDVLFPPLDPRLHNIGNLWRAVGAAEEAPQRAGQLITLPKKALG